VNSPNVIANLTTIPQGTTENTTDATSGTPDNYRTNNVRGFSSRNGRRYRLGGHDAARAARGPDFFIRTAPHPGASNRVLDVRHRARVFHSSLDVPLECGGSMCPRLQRAVGSPIHARLGLSSNGRKRGHVFADRWQADWAALAQRPAKEAVPHHRSFFDAVHSASGISTSLTCSDGKQDRRKTLAEILCGPSSMTVVLMFSWTNSKLRFPFSVTMAFSSNEPLRIQ